MALSAVTHWLCGYFLPGLAPRRPDHRVGSRPRQTPRRPCSHWGPPRWRVGRRCGLIPACAEQMSRGSKSIPTSTAHPRVCGADPRSVRPGALHNGSSPRVRSRPQGRQRRCEGGRLIPACAEQTTTPSPLIRSKSAHPRVCGADGPYRGPELGRGGSSPRVRSRPSRAVGRFLGAWLIPACAEQTLVEVVVA